MKYAVSYNIGFERHTRYYRALNKQTALEMFKETQKHGGLQAYHVTDINIKAFPSSSKNKA